MNMLPRTCKETLANFSNSGRAGYRLSSDRAAPGSRLAGSSFDGV